MKIKHVTGTSVDTDTLPDVDALLMEESKKLHGLFAQYNRQLFLTGEMKPSEKITAQQGCVFFHIGSPGLQNSPEEHGKAINIYYSRLDAHIKSLTGGQLGIGRIPPPQVEPYSNPPES